jgi:DNA-cytosine methyltransferase
MKYGSVCSGIEAASVAWHDLGWEPQWFSEIEQFPSEVLKHRFPDVPNLGDMTQLTQNPTFNERSIDLLVGGTPCQSFSVAGLRKGLADPRGNLMLTFLALADAKKPKWIVWENVPGVLSSNGGRDFGTFLGALGELGYGFAYRVLDAQYFGVAQRRRRVFVVGYLGDWRVAAAVLFERESLQGNIKPSRKKREEAASNVEGSVGATVFAGNQQSEIAATLQTTCDDYSRADGFNVIIDRAAFNQGENAPKDVADTVSARYGTGGGNTPLVQQPFRKVRRAQSDSDFETWEKDETANTINCFDVGDVRSTNVVAQPISIDAECNARTNQFGTLVRGGEGGTQQFVAQPIPVLAGEHPQKGVSIDVCPTLPAAMGMGGGHTPLVPHPVAQPIAFEPGKMQRLGYGYSDNGTSPTLRSEPGDNQLAVAQPIAIQDVRPIEKAQNGRGWNDDGTSYTVDTKATQGVAQPIAFKVRGGCEGGGKGYLGQEEQAFTISATQDQQIAQPIAVDWRTAQVDQGITQTLKTDLAKMSGPCIAVDVYNQSIDGQTSATITEAVGGTNTSGPKVMHSMAIRRLTPKECERLQGFPDDWTKIPYRNKPADQCPDGPRYKACGNSMAVPVMRWIGQRIQYVENLMKEL